VSKLLAEAIEYSNKMELIANQLSLIKEEYQQKLYYYALGGSFECSKEFISFIKLLVDLNNTENVVVVDLNNIPIQIPNLKDFLSEVLNCHFTATNEYYTKYNSIVSQKNIELLVDIND
jgi:hypothetical protein